MNRLFREKLVAQLAAKVGVANAKSLTYKDCEKIAIALDCDPNTVARLAGIKNFKPTESLKPDVEQKIAVLLGFETYHNLELYLWFAIVLDFLSLGMFEKSLQSKK